MKTKQYLLFFFIILILAGVCYAVPQDPYIIYGKVTFYDTGSSSTIDAPIGTVITATSPNGNTSSVTTTEAGYYGRQGTERLVLTSDNSGAQTVTFSATASGYTVTGYTATFTFPGRFQQYHLNFVATAVTTAAAGGLGGGGGAAVSAAAPAETLTTVTSEAVVNEITATLPEGWVNVKVEQVGEAKTETVTAADINAALSAATETSAISALQQVKNAISNNEVSQVTVSKTLHVYKASNLETGEAVYRSEITLTITAPNNMENVRIIEVVLKSVAQSSDDLIFLGQVPNTLQKDPILEWLFTKLSKGETKELSYIVKKKLAAITSTSLSVGKEVVVIVEEKPPVKEEKKTPFIFTAEAWIGIMIIVFIVAIGLIIYYVYTKPKTEKKEAKTFKKVNK